MLHYHRRCFVSLLSSAWALGYLLNPRKQKTRHIAVHYRWVQQRVKNGDLVVDKCWGGGNPADHLTKYLNRATMGKRMEIFGLKVCEGRAALAPTITSIGIEV